MKRTFIFILTQVPLVSLAACPQDIPLAKIGSREISLSYYRVVEESLSPSLLRKYYGGEEGKRKLLNKLLERQLILSYEEKKGLFKRPEVRKQIERFTIKRLAYSYLNDLVGKPAVSKSKVDEILDRLKKKGKKITPDLQHSVEINLKAQEFVRRRQKFLSKIEKEIEFRNLSPKKDSDVVAIYKGKAIRLFDLRPILPGKFSNKLLRRAVIEYALYLKAKEAGYEKHRDFQDELLKLKEELAVRDFKRELLSKVSVSEKEIKDYYEKHKSELRLPGRATVVVYVFDTLKEAEAARNKLSEGFPVDKAVPEKVRFTAKKWTVSSSDKKNPISKLVFDSKENYLLLAVPSGKVLLIEVLKRKPPKPMKYGDAYGTVKRKLELDRYRKLLEEKIEELKREYGFKIYRENLRCLTEE